MAYFRQTATENGLSYDNVICQSRNSSDNCSVASYFSEAPSMPIYGALHTRFRQHVKCVILTSSLASKVAASGVDAAADVEVWSTVDGTTTSALSMNQWSPLLVNYEKSVVMHWEECGPTQKIRDGGSGLLPCSFVVGFNRLWLWISVLGPLPCQCITTDYSYLITNRSPSKSSSS